MKDRIREILLRSGALAVGFSRAEEVKPEVGRAFERWLDKGHNAGMDFMSNYMDIRRDPRRLLDGAQSVISLAFGYRNHQAVRQRELSGLPRISSYAFIPDYHNRIRKLIRRSGVGTLLGEEGKDWRICVDSAPIMERYRAVESGIGMLGRNGMVIIPGYGSEVFLAEIISVQEFQPDVPTAISCDNCGLCRKACPTGALQADGTIDCDRCLSYLTIEHRGEWIAETHRQAMATPEGRNTLFGCDRCVSVCPHNTYPHNNHTTYPDNKRTAYSDNNIESTDTELLPDIVGLTAQEIETLDEETLRMRLRGSSLKRAGIEGLRRNAQNNSTPPSPDL